MEGLSIRTLESGYGGKAIVENLSLEARPREVIVIMGPSGSGKSTLLLTILGIVIPSHGQILLDNRDITSLPIEERSIGYLPQDYGLFPHMNVLENVSYGLWIRGVPKRDRDAIAREMLDLVDLRGYEDRRVTELSGGQRQRVGLARALATRPRLLLLDEPLSNIDQVTKFEVVSMLKELFKKLDVPVLLVTHNRDDALFLAERLVIMIEGRIVQEGLVSEIIRSPKSEFIKRLLMPFGEIKQL